MTDSLLKTLQDIEANIEKFTDNFTSNSHLSCTKLFGVGKLRHYKRFLNDKTLKYKDCVFIKTSGVDGGYLTNKNNIL